MNTRRQRWVGPLVSLGLLAGAIWLLQRSLADLRWVDLWRALDAIPLHSILAAIGLTAISHVALSLQDYIGVRYIRRRIPVYHVPLATLTVSSIRH